MSREGKIGLKWAICIALATAAFCCGIPFYGFFFHCPDSTELLQARRSIRVGMPLSEAKSFMPRDYQDFPDKSASGR
ncbi:MAG: hypothetical protein ABL962_15055, partial [Fimbriimonadaceae bacterium]